mmetsp:Transcript_22659/g.57071  ORF Transcript_22659/g.57071 Transcript_22659/m.57071 type:complete len:473 (+) Transcript_22659:239-1657(+)
MWQGTASRSGSFQRGHGGNKSRGDLVAEDEGRGQDEELFSPKKERATSLPTRVRLLWLRYAGYQKRMLLLTVLTVAAIFALHVQWRHRLIYTSANVKYSWVLRTEPRLFPISADGTAPGDYPADGKLRYAHMGMINHMPNGSLAAIFQASTRHFEGSAEQSLYWSTSSDGGATWSGAQVLIASEGVPLWSPVLLAEGRRMFLLHSRSSRKCKYFDGLRGVIRFSPGGDIVMATSDNNGKAWSSPQVVFGLEAEDGIPKVIANKVSVLKNGRWVLPFWREPGKTCPVVRNQVPHSEWVNGSAGVLITETQGLSWSVSPKFTLPEHRSWLIENTVVQTPSGYLLQLFRTGLGSVYQAWSPDFGNSWSRAVPTTLPNPNSKVHMITLSNGHLLVAYNHSPDARSPLSLALSRNEGRTWRMVGELETDPGLQFAYPTLEQHGNRLHVIYSVMRADPAYRLICQGIKVASMDLDLLG